jgi:hypothetical protein
MGPAKAIKVLLVRQEYLEKKMLARKLTGEPFGFFEEEIEAIDRAVESLKQEQDGSSYDDGWNAGIEAAAKCVRTVDVVETVHPQTHGEDGIETLANAAKTIRALKVAT